MNRKELQSILPRGYNVMYVSSLFTITKGDKRMAVIDDGSITTCKEFRYTAEWLAELYGLKVM